VPGVEQVRTRLPDPYTIPKVKDSYSALFWMDYRDQYIAGADAPDRNNYPNLFWACDDFHGARKSPLSACDCPLIWEALASEAHYDRLQVLSPALAAKKVSPPHAWQTAEVRLYLLDQERRK